MNDFGRLFHYELDMVNGELQVPAGEIMQIAELAIVQGSEIKAHRQVCDEITYVISGKATVWSAERQFEVGAGQIHYVKKGEYHRISADRGENFRYCCIGFQLNGQCRDIGRFIDAVMHRRDFLIRDEGNIKNLFPLLIDEFHSRDSESRSMIHFYFCQMLIQIYRMLSGSSLEKLNRLNTSASNAVVYRALRYIDREYPNLTQSGQVAKAISYSEYYVSHIFKERMGITVKEYLMRKKIKMAAELLETSSMNVSEIAEALSFSTPHSFGLAFRRYMQVSPSEYRAGTKTRKETIAEISVENGRR